MQLLNDVSWNIFDTKNDLIMDCQSIELQIEFVYPFAYDWTHFLIKSGSSKNAYFFKMCLDYRSDLSANGCFVY